MSSSNKPQQSEEEILRKLEHANPDEAKKIVLDSIIPECKDIASNFFDCVEEQFKTLDMNKVGFQDVEKMLNNEMVPKCMTKYNLESCLSKYAPENKNL